MKIFRPSKFFSQKNQKKCFFCHFPSFSHTNPLFFFQILLQNVIFLRFHRHSRFALTDTLVSLSPTLLFLACCVLSLCISPAFLRAMCLPTPYTVHHTPYTIHRTPYTVHHTPYTVHHTPYTVHCTPYTVHRTPYTVHLTPYTLHHTPYTIHRTPKFHLILHERYTKDKRTINEP